MDWGHILSVTIGFVIGFIIKTLLDFNIAVLIIKYLNWAPVRWLFRTNPQKLSGMWDQLWVMENSSTYPEDIDRHSNVEFKQLGSYCYGVFYSKGVGYVIFGQIKGEFLFGQWYDQKDKLGYFGTFQLRIIDSNTMSGKWIGHSKKSHIIHGDIWRWQKINGS